MSVVTRFAPSPTGPLHLGHAYAALLASDLARTTGGRFVMRIEDIDLTRCRDEFVTGIEADLAWLGITYDTPVRRQSLHFADYAAALARLDEAGLLYPCTCTRADIAGSAGAPHGPLGVIYPGTCRARPPDLQLELRNGERPFVLRLDVAQALARIGGTLTFCETSETHGGTIAATPALFGDVVLARKDIPVSYHLCVTVDDALQGVTLVTRGEDLFPATHIHRLLQALLDYPVPDYLHHRLIYDDAGRRLAKRDKAATLGALRAAGTPPEKVRGLVGL